VQTYIYVERYIKVAHLQLSSCRVLLTHRLQAKSGGSIMVEGTEAQCYVMEEFEEMASSIWHGKVQFEVGDNVEARYQGQLSKWAPARIVKVNPWGNYDLIFTGGKVNEQTSMDKSYVRKIQSIAHIGGGHHGNGNNGNNNNSGAGKRTKSKSGSFGGKRAEWGVVAIEWQHGAFRRACECDKLTTVKRRAFFFFLNSIWQIKMNICGKDL
jgi:hypothetical protein